MGSQQSWLGCPVAVSNGDKDERPKPEDGAVLQGNVGTVGRGRVNGKDGTRNPGGREGSSQEISSQQGEKGKLFLAIICLGKWEVDRVKVKGVGYSETLEIIIITPLECLRSSAL